MICLHSHELSAQPQYVSSAISCRLGCNMSAQLNVSVMICLHSHELSAQQQSVRSAALRQLGCDMSAQLHYVKSAQCSQLERNFGS